MIEVAVADRNCAGLVGEGVGAKGDSVAGAGARLVANGHAVARRAIHIGEGAQRRGIVASSNRAIAERRLRLA